MKKNIIISGIISGLIVTVMLIYSTAMCYEKEDFQGSMLLGYATMLIAFSTIFVAVKSYRDKYGEGVISFGKAFQLGLYISLIASTIYVVVWLVDYYLFIPDFMDKYTAHVLKALKNEGVSQVEFNAKSAELAGYKEMYKSPVYIVLLTYAEILPVGLLISVISALVLKRKPAS